jgi:hypothetical protein
MLKSKILWGVLICLILAGGAFALYQWNYLRIAHSTFDTYYAFRGCTQLVSRTDTSGTCKLANGQTITIVEYHNKWYLQGDLPWACVSSNLCFGI